MKLIRCQKCGTVVISEETFLQNIMDAMEDTARHGARNTILRKMRFCRKRLNIAPCTKRLCTT